MSVVSRWLPGWGRAVLFAAPLALQAILLPGIAAAGPALLVDDTSGDVLFADSPDQSWYPASLTKLMTAYVTFEAISRGQITLQSVVPLSEKARAQPATRIGLRQGIELNVEQAVRGLILLNPSPLLPPNQSAQRNPRLSIGAPITDALCGLHRVVQSGHSLAERVWV